MTRRRGGVSGVLALALALLSAAPAASARDAVVRSFDGTPIVPTSSRPQGHVPANPRRP